MRSPGNKRVATRCHEQRLRWRQRWLSGLQLRLCAVDGCFGCFDLRLARDLGGFRCVQRSLSGVEIRFGRIDLLLGDGFQIFLEQAVITVVVDLCDIKRGCD